MARGEQGNASAGSPAPDGVPEPVSDAEGSALPGAGGEGRARSFIHQLAEDEIARGVWGPPGDRSVLTTRFPPEPNGYLHVGHAKSICLNFGLAESFGGRCALRFDDTNPEKEEEAYVRSIVRDVRWLGFAWPGADPADHGSLAGVRFASDLFGDMYRWASLLVEDGKAYVDEQSPEQIRAGRGDLKRPGTPSPFRDRPAAESLELLERMRTGGVADGSMVLRAKIDMASPNMNLRDPVMYRVVRAPHHRTGDAWSVYPMYDWAHGLEDSAEGVTHSLCTLEFEDHRPLYDWFIGAVNAALRARGEAEIHHARQTEFARLNPTYVVTSKRKLRQLVDEGRVSGWDDPRMPTISGLRRRGFTAESVRAFCDGLGVTKMNATHDLGLLENALRDDLNRRAPRRMAVLRPLRVVIENWAEHGEAGRVEAMRAVNNPEIPGAGEREVPFSGVLYVERDDFQKDAPKKWFRLAPGKEVRLRYGYWITCVEAVEEGGEVVELRCTYDPLTRGGDAPPPGPDGVQRKVKGTLHWVAACEGALAPVEVEARLFDRLYAAERPGKKTGDHLDDLNPGSLEVVRGALLEPNWGITDSERAAGSGVFADSIDRFQFERLGYFCQDTGENTDASRGRDGGATGSPNPGITAAKLVFNRAVTLKDSWAKLSTKG